MTGLPTVLGWEQHERHWRGWTEAGSDTETQTRRADVNFIYQSDDIDQVQTIISKYNIEFVYVGDLERASYGEDVGVKFAAFMDIVFENEGVTIYKVRD
jgi:uncharacterized membrane protein